MTTIDLRPTCEPPIRYDVVCGEHGTLVGDVDQRDAGQVALQHDVKLHECEAEWLYGGLSIIGPLGEPSATESPAAIAVDERRSRRKVSTAQGALL